VTGKDVVRVGSAGLRACGSAWTSAADSRGMVGPAGVVGVRSGSGAAWLWS